MTLRFERLSVLVVEDTSQMQKLVSSVLGTLGIGQIYAAEDGETGYDKFCEYNPDIVLTDWHMPKMSGMELVQKIRNDKKSPNKTVPIIMMTGFSAMDRVANARDLGTTEFLVKPFKAEDLAKRIAYVINKPRDFIRAPSYFGPDRRRISDPNYTGLKRRETDYAKP